VDPDAGVRAAIGRNNIGGLQADESIPFVSFKAGGELETSLMRMDKVREIKGFGNRLIFVPSASWWVVANKTVQNGVVYWVGRSESAQMKDGPCDIVPYARQLDSWAYFESLRQRWFPFNHRLAIPKRSPGDEEDVYDRHLLTEEKTLRSRAVQLDRPADRSRFMTWFNSGN
jgi:hypothetical protein